MFKVTLMIKPENEWVDGPTYLLSASELEEFSKTHAYFKVESAKEDDEHVGTSIPQALKDLFS